MRVDTLHGLPTCERGYISSGINDRSLVLKEITKWHGRHKPYACDFPSELIKR